MNPIGLFVKNTAYQMFSQIMFRLIGSVVGIIIIRYLTKDVYGQLTLILAIVGFTNLLSNIGLPTMVIKSISQFYKDNEPLAASYYRFNLKLYASITLIFSIALFFSAPLISRAYNLPQITHLIRLATILYILFSFFSFYEWVFAGINEFKPFSLKVCLPREIIIFILTILVLFLGLGVPAILTAQMLGMLVGLVVAIKIISSRLNGKSENIDKRWIIKSALQIAPANISYASMVHMDLIIIGALLSTSLLANYKVCLSIIMIAISLFPIYIFVLPTFNLLTRERANILLNDILKLAIIVVLPMMFFASSFSKEILSVLFGQKYLDSNHLLSIFSFILLGHFITGIFVGTITYLGRFKAMSKITVTMTVINVILLVTLTKSFGLTGAIIASLILYYGLSLLLGRDINRNGMNIKLKVPAKIMVIGIPLVANLIVMNKLAILPRCLIFVATVAIYIMLLKVRGIFAGLESFKDIRFRSGAV